MKPQIILLLGGYDLELLEIKKIAKSFNNILVFDKQLKWHNANLSMYQSVLKKYGNDTMSVIYGIELREDDGLQIPFNYYRIDHHNACSADSTSLEQIAVILNIELTREQHLIAANDRGYIPEMQRLGASDEEIRQIRLRDRMTQGVTEEDEQLAAKALENRTIEQGVIIVKSETNRFSPICDQLFPYDKLLIYTHDELMYYGKGKEKLSTCFESEIKAGKMFHGGGAEGYIGTAQGIYPYKEIISMKDIIIQLIK